MKALSVRLVFLVSTFFVLAPLRPAHAFPELVRHGYANCASCHASVGGGGVLTAYGRELSREVLSTWGAEKESAFAWGLTPEIPNVQTTALFRGLQVVQSLPATATRAAEIEGRAVLMQADLEAAWTLGKLTAVGTLGYQDVEGSERSAVLSRRHFLSYQATDELSFRAGRFYPVYGLMIAEHQRAIRSRLGFDQGNETYNLEAAWVGEKLSLFGSAVLAKDFKATDKRAAVLTGEWFFGNRFKAGVSAQLGERPLLGPHVALGITPRLFYLGELDLQRRAGDVGFAQYQKLSFEVFQGFHLFGVQEWTRTKFAPDAQSIVQYGPGIQWFPRPHFELQLSWEWVEFPANAALDRSLGLGMLNFYL